MVSNCFVLRVSLDFVCKAKKARGATARVVHRPSKYMIIARASLIVLSREELESRQTIFEFKRAGAGQKQQNHIENKSNLRISLQEQLPTTCSISILLSPTKHKFFVAIPEQLTLEDKKNQIFLAEQSA